MLTVLVRTVILFGAAVVIIRAMGKRQVGQLQPFDLVVMIMVAELAATPIGGPGVPIWQGILPIAALMVCHTLITVLCMRSQRVRIWLCGQPTVLVRNGAICEKQMRRMSITMNDLMEAFRTGGVLDPSEVGTAILETGGQVSVFPKAEYRPLSPSDMGRATVPEGLPLPLILDGKVQEDNLTRGHLTKAWLAGQLRALGYESEAKVLFACLNTRGTLLVQGKGRENVHLVEAIAPEKAVW